MKMINLFIAVAFLSFSCQKDEVKPSLQWKTVKVSGAVTIDALYGSIDDMVLIATSKGILRSTDHGTTWSLVFSSDNYPVTSIYGTDGRIYAAAYPNIHVSDDRGQTWKLLGPGVDPGLTNNQFEDSRGILYRIVNNAKGELALPTTVLRSSDGGNSWEIVTPEKRMIYKGYVDDADRFYVFSSGANWNAEASAFVNDDVEKAAYIYYLE